MTTAGRVAERGSHSGSNPSAAIVGLGLIGGSLARDLAAAGWDVLGGDREADAVAAAREAAVIRGAFDPLDGDSLRRVDLLVLAVPVRAAVDWIGRLAGRIADASSLVITDVGSTKRSIVTAAEAAGLGARFVGSHPLAGDHRSGWGASRTGLFRGARVWLCPTPRSSPGALERVRALWRTAEAHPRTIEPELHDRRLARASHLPQVVASALAGSLAAEGVAREDLGPGGRDTTRLADSDPEVWTDILMDNADEVAAALEGFARELTRLSEAVRAGDERALGAALAAAREWHRG